MINEHHFDSLIRWPKGERAAGRRADALFVREVLYLGAPMDTLAARAIARRCSLAIWNL